MRHPIPLEQQLSHILSLEGDLPEWLCHNQRLIHCAVSNAQVQEAVVQHRLHHLPVIDEVPLTKGLLLRIFERELELLQLRPEQRRIPAQNALRTVGLCLKYQAGSIEGGPACPCLVSAHVNHNGDLAATHTRAVVAEGRSLVRDFVLLPCLSAHKDRFLHLINNSHSLLAPVLFVPLRILL